MSYPFPYNVADTIHDDFVNLHITLDIDVAEILGNVAGEKPTEQVDEDNPESSDPGPGLSDAVEPIIGGLADLLGLGVGSEEEE